MKKKLSIVVIAVVLAGAGGAAWIWSLAPSRVLRIPGIVEIQEVRLGSKVSGTAAWRRSSSRRATWSRAARRWFTSRHARS